LSRKTRRCQFPRSRAFFVPWSGKHRKLAGVLPLPVFLLVFDKCKNFYYCAGGGGVMPVVEHTKEEIEKIVDGGSVLDNGLMLMNFEAAYCKDNPDKVILCARSIMAKYDGCGGSEEIVSLLIRKAMEHNDAEMLLHAAKFITGKYLMVVDIKSIAE